MTNLFPARSVIAGLGVLAMLAGIAAPADAQQRRLQREERRPLPSAGEPGRVVAADIAFAKAVREEGVAAALSGRARSDAVMHTDDGRMRAGNAPDASIPREVSPSIVWTSCDGSLSVSFGRYRMDDGIVGSYAAVWELTGGRDYKWSYRLLDADDPQPVPVLAEDEIADPDNTIVVPGLDIIEGQVADCARFADIPDLPAMQERLTDSAAGEASRDGTLYWRWSAHTDGSGRIMVYLLREGVWENALDFGTGRWSDGE